MNKTIGYLDREKATIAVLQDYHDQMWKLENDKGRMQGLLEGFTAPKGAVMQAAPGGDSRFEEALCEALDKKTAIEEGYRQAAAYHREFTPCWQRLTPDEQQYLTLRYIDYYEGAGVKRLMEKYHISKSEAYRRSEAALKRLAKLLYW